MIYGIFIALITLWIDEVTDLRLWKKSRNLYNPKGSVNHKRGTLLRCIGIIPAAWLITHSDGWWSIRQPWTYEHIIWLAGAMLFFWYWTLFDTIFNIKTGQKWFRVGTTNRLDIMQKNWPTWLRISVKIGGAISFTWLFIHFK